MASVIEMGTESACGSYYSEQQAGNGPEMSNYYQMNNGGDGGSGGGGGGNGGEGSRSTNNQQPEEEMAHSVGGSAEQAESKLDLRQQDQQRSIHNEPPRNPSLSLIHI